MEFNGIKFEVVGIKNNHWIGPYVLFAWITVFTTIDSKKISNLKPGWRFPSKSFRIFTWSVLWNDVYGIDKTVLYNLFSLEKIK